VLVPVAERPTQKMHERNIDNLFSVTLRDSGEIALIDGDTKEIVVISRPATRCTSRACQFRALRVHHRPRCQDRPDRPVDESSRRSSPRSRSAWRRARSRPRKYKGFEDKYAIAGAYWPPQFVIMDGPTLEPLKIVSTRGMTVDTQEYHPEPRVARSSPATSIRSSSSTSRKPARSCWSTTGHRQPADHHIDAARFLHDGGWDSTKRYFLTAANQSNKIAVVDSKERKLVSAGRRRRRSRIRAAAPISCIRSSARSG
jgi:nitrite reductase (NO-forming)/hydroxylamine reductase